MSFKSSPIFATLLSFFLKKIKILNVKTAVAPFGKIGIHFSKILVTLLVAFKNLYVRLKERQISVDVAVVHAAEGKKT